ncbi:MAG: glycosyltransferase family 39 protein [Nitrolancea sp.]
MIATAQESIADQTGATMTWSERRRTEVREDEHVQLWERLSVVGLLGTTALLYLWNLSASGWANAFYSAAVQAGTKSWTAFFFGSFDSSNFITVDKPPAALWIMELSARIFGVSSWSILAPEALEGVAAVGLLYLTIRRWFSPAAALLAGAVMALTPVAALMFRFNNPDALLVLLMVGAAYAVTRSLENGGTRWLLLAGALIGFGFLTKMLQAFLVVPPLALVYLIASPVSLRRRLGQLVAFGLSIIVSAGWWVAAVSLTPASARPYVGGSQDNSILNLIFGYNGFGRITGDETGSVGGAPGNGGGRWGPTGLLRLFGSEMGTQVSWLLPLALLSFTALLWFTWRKPRTDRVRAAALLWGGWLLLTGVVFSLAQGIIHPYYTVALAPAIGALAGIGVVALWQRRDHWIARGLLAIGIATTAIWAYVLLDRSPNWYPLLRVSVLAAGIGAAVLLMTPLVLRRQAASAVIAIALIAALAGPAAYAAETATTPHSGAIPTAGPATSTTGPGGRPGGPAPNGTRTGFGGNGAPRFPGSNNANGGVPGAGTVGRNSETPGGIPAAGTNPFGGQNGGFGGGNSNMGGLLDASTPNSALVSLLKQDADSYTWVAAAVGANSAAGVQLAIDEPIMAIGGFNGTDPTPTLAEFQQYVSEGKIHYFIGGGGVGGGFRGGSDGTSGQISNWVQQNYTATTVGGITVYDLTQPVSGS